MKKPTSNSNPSNSSSGNSSGSSSSAENLTSGSASVGMEPVTVTVSSSSSSSKNKKKQQQAKKQANNPVVEPNAKLLINVDEELANDAFFNRTSTSLHEVDLNTSNHNQSAPVVVQPSTTKPTKTTTNVSLNKNTVDDDTQFKHSQYQHPQMLDNNAIHKLIMDEAKSVLVIDDNETLLVKSSQEFMALFKSSSSSPSSPSSSQHSLQSSSQTSLTNGGLSNGAMGGSDPLSSLLSPDDKLVKCVSIFGNTGDGKSHTLNHAFFNGRPIFRTSSRQETCTMGVWCAYDPVTNSLIFDTEGLLGTTGNENKRMRLLLKVLAVSDVIIYRTRAERLHNDLFRFLSDASQAYLKYFSKELTTAAKKLKLDTLSSLGPDCVIFHETQHTEPMRDELDANGHLVTKSHQIRSRFEMLELTCNAFSSINYVGTQTNFKLGMVATDFGQLAHSVRVLLENNSVRTPRKLSSIYHVLKVLNDKFNGVITKNQVSAFADEYFTCNAHCLSCGKRCQNSINHLKDGILHENCDKCHYHHQFDNKVYVCKKCHEQGKEQIVIPRTAAANDNSLIGLVKYTYSGYVLECPLHGIIYRSRQYWYGNPDPESVVRTELKHIWSGQQNHVGTSHNLSRKIIDNVSYIGDTLQSLSARPTSLAKQWMADKVAPAYWTPNSEIVECFSCKKEFTTDKKKHHCRGCGKGFCDKCSSKRRIIPWWSLSDQVRVCDACFEKDIIDEPKIPGQYNGGSQNPLNEINNSNTSLAALGLTGNQDVIVRKVTESVQETIGYIGYATKLPLDVLKESARPSYWKPDAECLKCAICSREFDGEQLLLHHCRSCGNGVCHTCSPHLRPVPSRGWETPVRVCNNCVSIEISDQ